MICKLSAGVIIKHNFDSNRKCFFNLFIYLFSFDLKMPYTVNGR